MGIRLEFNKEKGLIIQEFYESVSLEEFLWQVEKIREHPERDLYNKVLADLRKCTLNITRDDILRLTENVEKTTQACHYAPTKIAVLADDPKNTGMAALLGSYIDQISKCKVFSTEEAANTWLKSYGI